ncbi:putative membrane-bound spermidine synthase [Oxalobacteraceae bacterium GrIS 2.11]
MTIDKLNVDKPDGHDLTVSIEPVENALDQKARIFKEITLFVVGIVFISLIVGMCVATLYSSTSVPEEKKWAMSVLSAMAGAMVGYLVKK